MGVKIDSYHLNKTAAKSTTSKKNPRSGLSELLNKDIQLFGNGFGAKRKQSFYSNLKVLLASGLDIQRSLELFVHSEKKNTIKSIVAKIKDQIVEGKSLSEALKLSNKFSEYEIHSIRIGEESGQLLEVLDELSIFFGKTIKYRQQLVGALAYPSFVIGFSVLVVVFLLNYLVPLFSDIYKRIDGDLPSITMKVIALSDWLKGNVFWMLLSLMVVLGIIHFQKSKLWYRKTTSFLLIRIPVLGTIFRLIYLSRFCQSMHLLLKAKVPLLTAVELVTNMITFYPIQISLQKAATDILNGVPLSTSLNKFKFYPQQLIALLEVGEESGNIEEMFQKLSQQYNDEVEQKTGVIGSLIEPVLIVFVGLLVGSILIAMYLPLFQMSTGLGK